jgi:hypothetical protein
MNDTVKIRSFRSGLSISGRPNRSRGFEVLQLRCTRANAQAETSSAFSSAGLAGEIGLNLLTICGD